MAIAGIWAPTLAGSSLNARTQTMLAAAHVGGSTPLRCYDAGSSLCFGSTSADSGPAPALAHSRCGQHVLAIDGLVVAARGGTPCSAQMLVDAIAARGLQAVLAEHEGSFALAYWDRIAGCLSLVRDPVGQHGLFYAWWQGQLVFATSLRALRRAALGDLHVDRGVLALFLRHGYVPAPHCILKGAFKLRAGTWLPLTLREVHRGSEVHVPGVDQRCYRDTRKEQEAALQQRGAMVLDSVLDQLDAALHRAIDAVGHAPSAGAFLSGGADSSLVTAILQAQCSQPVPTVGIGFESVAHDERSWMKAVAQHLGVQHETVLFRAEDALAQVRRLPGVWCEPFADASQLPTLMASEHLALRCPVALTGDGGDELFFGHGAYRRAVRNARVGALLPDALRHAAQRWTLRDPEQCRLGGWAAVMAEMAGDGIAHHYLMRVSRWRSPLALLPGAVEPRTLYRDGPVRLHGGDDADVVQYLDMVMELGNGILVKTGRAAQSCGLQVVSPMLARGFMEQAWALPMSMKLRAGQQKWVLKKLLCRYLPEPLVYRPKQGFGPPITDWLRGPLREWAEALLSRKVLQDAGIADTAQVERMWAQFLGGERRWHPPLWTLLMYLAWFEAANEEVPCVGRIRIG